MNEPPPFPRIQPMIFRLVGLILMFTIVFIGLWLLKDPYTKKSLTSNEPSLSFGVTQLTQHPSVSQDVLSSLSTASPSLMTSYTPSTSQSLSQSPSPSSSGRWQPSPGASFQWQLTALPVDTSVDAAVYEIDGLDNDHSVVAALHAKGRKVICYIDVGSWESYRPDADRFSKDLIGTEYVGYPDEHWLNIREIDRLAPVLGKRFDTCRDKGFDAVEADNVDGFEQNTGFSLTSEDQLTFNRWVASEAHRRGLAVALKNDGSQAKELVNNFDFVVTEECVLQGNCDDYAPFRLAGKPQFDAEYAETAMTRSEMCDEARRTILTAVLKHRDLDAYRETCK